MKIKKWLYLKNYSGYHFHLHYQPHLFLHEQSINNVFCLKKIKGKKIYTFTSTILEFFQNIFWEYIGIVIKVSNPKNDDAATLGSIENRS